jgi:hypothetical protein
MAESARRRFLNQMAAHAPSNETLSRLALSCSALARSGQILSTISSPDAARNALLEAATILEADARKSGWTQIEQAAAECRSVAASVSDADSIASCRRLATKLARQASTLATEVQQQTRKTHKPAGQPDAVIAASTIPAPAPAPVTSSAPPPSAAPTPARRMEQPAREAPRPVAARATPRDADIARVRVATSAVEREAVTAALLAGDRFAVVGADTIIDVNQNRMWLARLGPAGPYRTAQEFVAGCRAGGYSDWRLPRPDELQQLLSAGGRAWAIAHGLFEAGSGTAAGRVCVWTCDTRWRWRRFRREVTVIDLRTSQVGVIPASNRTVRVMALR